MILTESRKEVRVGQIIVLIFIVSLLTGCVYWRLYKTKLQMNEFDRYFAVKVTDSFVLNFKEPVIEKYDFDDLSKLHPSFCSGLDSGSHCVYRFDKVNRLQQLTTPAVSFFFDLSYDSESHLSSWLLSPLFLKIAPPEFLEVSLRSLGGGKINRDKHQLKADVSTVEKITAELPGKEEILKHLGAPLEINTKPDLDVLVYYFLLDTENIEPAYQERALSIIRLSFEKETDKLVRMEGSFAGLKIAIDYRKYLASPVES